MCDALKVSIIICSIMQHNSYQNTIVKFCKWFSRLALIYLDSSNKIKLTG